MPHSPIAYPSVICALILAICLIAAPAQALDRVEQDGSVTLQAGEHHVLADFNSANLGDAFDLGSATTINYAVALATGSVQQEFDVLLMTYDDYLNYSAGLPFHYISTASSLGAGASPAVSSYIFMFEDRYVLLIDNSDLGFEPIISGDLMVSYQFSGTYIDLMGGSNWNMFFALMALVAVCGAAFLIVLRVAMRYKLKKAEDALESKCYNCGRFLPAYGEFCPHCGKQR